MKITNAALEALRTGFNKKFQDGQTKAKGKASVMATPVSSSTKTETYAFLGALPTFRKWLGDKRFQSIAERAYKLVNDPYEATWGIHKHEIEDDNLGLYPAMFEGWGQEAELWPDRLLF